MGSCCKERTLAPLTLAPGAAHVAAAFFGNFAQVGCYFFPLLPRVVPLFGAAAKLQVSPGLCKPARAVREIPFLPDGAGICRCIGNPACVCPVCVCGNTSLSLNCSSACASENGAQPCWGQWGDAQRCRSSPALLGTSPLLCSYRN